MEVQKLLTDLIPKEPGGIGHHGSHVLAVFVTAAGINVEDAFLACLKHADGIVQVVLIAESKNAGIVDH